VTIFFAEMLHVKNLISSDILYSPCPEKCALY